MTENVGHASITTRFCYDMKRTGSSYQCVSVTPEHETRESPASASIAAHARSKGPRRITTERQHGNCFDSHQQGHPIHIDHLQLLLHRLRSCLDLSSRIHIKRATWSCQRVNVDRLAWTT